jgi:hypothetical protein
MSKKYVDTLLIELKHDVPNENNIADVEYINDDIIINYIVYDIIHFIMIN